jgi:hypothetical protein
LSEAKEVYGFDFDFPAYFEAQRLHKFVFACPIDPGTSSSRPTINALSEILRSAAKLFDIISKEVLPLQLKKREFSADMIKYHGINVCDLIASRANQHVAFYSRISIALATSPL